MAKKRLPASERLKAFRKARELTLKKFGKSVGVGAGRVCEWEGAVCKPDAPHRIAIAEFTKLFGDEIRVEDW